MRLFIAMELSEEMKDALRTLQAEWRRRGVRGNYTKAENLHLTLAFIGDYPDPQAVLRVMEGVPFSPVPLALSGVGSFGSLWWAGLRGCDPLAAYVGRLRRALGNAGIPFDRKRFSPHVTLLRRPDANRIPPVAVGEAGMTARRVELMSSRRGRDGMIYTPLGGVEAPDR